MSYLGDDGIETIRGHLVLRPWFIPPHQQQMNPDIERLDHWLEAALATQTQLPRDAEIQPTLALVITATGDCPCQLPGHLGEVVGQTGQRRYLDTARQTSSVARELDTVDRRRNRLIGLLGCLEHHKR
ncbi:MAG: hypothetical protein IPF74_15240 [Rhodocyclaceae bacterium]|nr:hypothetical protein [Rhodocyclaceae bacterium]